MWTTPEKHTKRRVGNANQNKTTKRAGYKKVYEKPPKEVFRIKGACWNTGQNKNKNSNSNSETEEGKRKSPKMKHSNWKGALKNHSEKNRAYKMLKETTKPLRRRVLIEESLAKSSTKKKKKKKHLENTDKWHLCKTGSFSYGESLWTPPLEGTSLHQWNNSVERPWGILSLLTTCLRMCVKSPCHWLWHVDYPQKAY